MNKEQYKEAQRRDRYRRKKNKQLAKNLNKQFPYPSQEEKKDRLYLKHFKTYELDTSWEGIDRYEHKIQMKKHGSFLLKSGIKFSIRMSQANKKRLDEINGSV